jgi:hypothetical protein
LDIFSDYWGGLTAYHVQCVKVTYFEVLKTHSEFDKWAFVIIKGLLINGINPLIQINIKRKIIFHVKQNGTCHQRILLKGYFKSFKILQGLK